MVLRFPFPIPALYSERVIPHPRRKPVPAAFSLVRVSREPVSAFNEVVQSPPPFSALSTTWFLLFLCSDGPEDTLFPLPLPLGRSGPIPLSSNFDTDTDFSSLMGGRRPDFFFRLHSAPLNLFSFFGAHKHAFYRPGVTPVWR